jgi:phytoene dehydrogenase-like protein
MNALVAGAMLAKDGWSVAVCERSDRPGGAIFTSTDTFDGYTVELLSSWHPLFLGGPAYAVLADDLAARGVRYVNTTSPTGVVCADGSAVLSTDPDRNAEQFGVIGGGKVELQIAEARNRAITNLIVVRAFPNNLPNGDLQGCSPLAVGKSEPARIEVIVVGEPSIV